MTQSPHLLAAVSAHGLGHLAQIASVINALRRHRPEVAVTVRSGHPREVVADWLEGPFAHQPVSDDFGLVMHDAVTVDAEASLARYRALHADWEAQVEAVAADLAAAAPDLVLADIPYLTLAAAHRLGLPSVAMCSLNWRDILAPLAPEDSDMRAILATMEAAYNGARAFLQPAPAMPMPSITNGLAIGPVGRVGRGRSAELRQWLGAEDGEPVVLVAMGGIQPSPLPVAPDCGRPIHWLRPPRAGEAPAPRQHDPATLGWPFPDLLASVDAVVTKPGYGTFVEAAAAGCPVVTLDRAGWAEAPALLAFLRERGGGEVVPADAGPAAICRALDAVLERDRPEPQALTGNEEAAEQLWMELRRGSREGEGGQVSSVGEPERMDQEHYSN
ncbi:UDP:flavonoid glycosyltransferase YjiC, YdhE family [Thiohalospira halophila DSM 15071]|uniref:UDP:flavonoid glycosyltransferase YjiC, YdhE family n=1 Tax=Thiohalospira halophila DSM 15071 TaxID=1123397 RepID=A0A1I1NH77_9GAMM|nr:hypothetical protein [Thiohalospira halophila]SFC96786.1 UDP:flavonoid glycosyltransferase YjiC, YdhE family [Thiohalospira halophila DSM 15071]